MRKDNMYFKKDKKVKLIKQREEQDEYGAPYTAYVYITPPDGIWAYAKQLSQQQIFECRQFGENETRLFVLNYRNDITLYDLVEYRGHYYSITRLDTKDDYRNELFVYAKDVPEETVGSIQPMS